MRFNWTEIVTICDKYEYTEQMPQADQKISINIINVCSSTMCLGSPWRCLLSSVV